MATQFDCVPTSATRQANMLGENTNYNNVVNNMNYDVNKGYTGSLADFQKTLTKGGLNSDQINLEGITNYNKNTLLEMYDNQNPIGVLEKVTSNNGTSYWHYSTVRSITISKFWGTTLRISDPQGFIRSINWRNFFFLIH